MITPREKFPTRWTAMKKGRGPRRKCSQNKFQPKTDKKVKFEK
jgi:hypothetical protein